MDGDFTSLAATQSAQGQNQWASVRVALPSGKAIGHVAVYNRADGQPYEGWLSPYEVWLGSGFGSLQHQCGGSLTAGSGLGPFMTLCTGPTSLTYVTILIRSSSTARYLTLGEIQVYARST